jgi:hypothetical protein
MIDYRRPSLEAICSLMRISWAFSMGDMNDEVSGTSEWSLLSCNTMDYVRPSLEHYGSVKWIKVQSG